jgi:hypothetical protein
VKELLLQFPRRVELRICTGTIKKEKDKEGEVDNQIISIRSTKTLSLEGKKRENISLLANSFRKQII